MNKRVLVAEDDANARELLVAMLRHHGIDASPARDGHDAIDRLRDEAWDLVVVDLLMPRIDGYVVLRFLEEHTPGTRAIVISGLGAEELEDVSRSASVVAALAKPVDVERLVTRIEETVGH